MLACHLASTFALLLYFHGAITETWQIAFETLLLVFKTCAELLLIDFTLDLAAHHIAMFFASWVVNTYFPAHAYLVVYCQSIHLALALHYSRKVSGLKSGSTADRIFLHVWCAIVGARNTMMVLASVIAVRTADPVCSILLPLTVLILVLDVLWTFESFGRRKAGASAAALGLAGIALGLLSGPQADASARAHIARAVWASLSAMALAIAFFVLSYAPAVQVINKRKAECSRAAAGAVRRLRGSFTRRRRGPQRQCDAY